MRCRLSAGILAVLALAGCATSQPVSPTVATEPPGPNCAAGGVKIQLGDEAPSFVCNGAAGANGERGDEGALGQPGVSVSVTPEPAGSNCQYGGAKLNVGTGPSTYVCAGAPGKDGTSVQVSPEMAGTNCPTGGVKVQVGSTGTPNYVCNGQNGLSASVTPETAGTNCPTGGVKVQVGSTGTPNYVCNGQNGLSASVTPESSGTNCPAGGVKVQVGSSGTPSYVCNGQNGEGATVTPELSGTNCPAGGFKVQVGASGAPNYVCNGQDGQSAAVTPLATGNANCAYGGISVQVGTGTPSYVCNGAPGDAGVNGLNPTITTLATGDANCAYGGISVQVGTGTPSYVCNGAPGDAGVNGLNGLNGLNPTITTLAVGNANCPFGGVSVQVGTGTPSYACNGTPGDAGVNGLSPTVTTLAAGNANCPSGGLSVQVGTGTPSYVCNGAPGDAGTNGANALVKEVTRLMVTTECPYGGKYTYFGTDDNRNNDLDLPGEVDATNVVCFAIDQDGDGANFGADNCPGVANPTQSDLDMDGLGDDCDTTPCPGTLTFCSAICQDLQTSPTACGSCTNTCSGGANATATCTAGACGLSCTTGFLSCDGNLTNGCETDGRSDNNNCGACNNACTGSSTCIDSVCTVSIFVAPTGDDTTGAGTEVAPYATIGKGLTAAAAVAAPARVAVKVAAGTYAISAQLAVPTRTRLMGGYAAGDWALRDPATNATIVDANGFMTDYAVKANSGSVGIDGIRVLNTAVTTSFTPNNFKACFDLSSANGGLLVDSACTIQNCGYNDSCYGAQIGSNGRAERNIISITPGVGMNSSADALYVQGNGTITVRRNTITNTYSGRYNYGIHVVSNGFAVTLNLENNLVNANVTFTGNGGNTVDIGSLPASSAIFVRNNTIRGGAANTSSAFWSLRIASQANPVHVENNLIFTVGSAVSTNGCLSLPSTFTNLRNNNLFDCGGTLVNDGTARATIADVNALTNAGANLNFDMVNGTNNFFTNETSDFSLKAGGTAPFTTVKQGGLERSSAYTVDLTGATRTASAGTGWSMGAYEQDN